jgi:hypothetical protein
MSDNDDYGEELDQIVQNTQKKIDKKSATAAPTSGKKSFL